MKQAWRKYLREGAPRYTSYPSALHFDQSVASDDFAEKVSEIDLYEPLSLYVHVPFCSQLCWYCGCNMRVENNYQRARRYVDALKTEISQIGQVLAGRGQPLSVHFGGGTPNYLHCEDLGDILSAIEREFGLTDSTKLAIELDPRLVRENDIQRLAAIGFSRFSLGVQDFDPVVQRAINRIQDFELIESCVSAARAEGVDDLSFDILYGLPHQTSVRFAATIAKVVSLSPDRVSVFGYAHMPHLLARQKLIDPAALPDSTLRCDLALLADEMLISAGYVRVGFDHYAKPDNSLARASREGRLKRNFQGFTDDAASTLIGLGASAVSFVDGLYAQNEKSVASYTTRALKGEIPTARGLKRSKREASVAAAISDLLCNMQSDVGSVLRCSPPSDAIRICAALEQLEADGLICWRGDKITVANGAHAFARSVAAAIDVYALPQTEYAAAV